MDEMVLARGFDPVEENYRGVGYFLRAMGVDEDGEDDGDMLFWSPTFHAMRDCDRLHESLTPEDFATQYLKRGWDIRFVVRAVKAWYSHEGCTSCEETVWKRSYPIEWDGDKAIVQWDKEELWEDEWLRGR